MLGFTDLLSSAQDSSLSLGSVHSDAVPASSAEPASTSLRTSQNQNTGLDSSRMVMSGKRRHEEDTVSVPNTRKRVCVEDQSSNADSIEYLGEMPCRPNSRASPQERQRTELDLSSGHKSGGEEEVNELVVDEVEKAEDLVENFLDHLSMHLGV